MANKQVKMFNDWIASAQERVKSASVKVAADQEALNMKDPTDRGQVAIPDCGDGSNRAAQGLPTNTSNMGEPDKEHNIFDVTKPNGAGQGEYVVPKDGTAADEAVKSPTTPLSKMAQALKELQQKSAAAAAPAPAPAAPAEPAPVEAAPAEPVKKASQGTFELPVSLLPDSSLMDKLASIGGIMLGSEAGQKMVAEVLEKEAGIAEARAIIAEAQATMEKEAASQFYAENNMTNNQPNTAMDKSAAAAKSAHIAWYNSFNTDMEKNAYMNGAEDGAAVADAIEAGEDPEALADVSDEDVIAYLQELVASGQISQEEAEAVLQAIGDAGEDGLTPEEMAQALTAAVEAGEITPEHAQALAQQYMAEFGAGEAAGAEDAAAAEAAAMEDPAVQEAAAAATEKTASVINHLWTPNMA